MTAGNQVINANGRRRIRGSDGARLLVPASGFAPLCACTQVPRSDQFIQPFDDRCPFGFEPECRPNYFTFEISGIQACPCFEDNFGGWVHITALSVNQTIEVPATSATDFCDYEKLFGSITWDSYPDEANCLARTNKISTTTEQLLIRGSNGLLDIFNEFEFFALFHDAFDPEIIFGEGLMVNQQTCTGYGEGGHLGQIVYYSGAVGQETTTPDPFQLSDSDWCDLANDVTDPVEGLYREYDFEILVQATLSDSSKVSGCVEVRVQADSSGCPSPTNKGVWIKTGTVTGSVTNMTIDDWKMEWTSNGWKLTLDLTDTTNSSSKTVTLLRNTADPYLCTGCWGVSSWQGNVRIGDVTITPVF
jgi:hypothetical protein